jgi:uncharacterized membrane protein YdjX (TVP38/TMEM64 family)
LPLAPTLLPGAEAYRRGDFTAAHTAWQRAAEALTDERERVLALALARLAESLAAPDGAAAAARFAEAEAALFAVADGTLGVDLLALRAALARGYAAARELPPALAARQRLPIGATLRFAALLALLVGGVLAVRFTPLGELLDREALVGAFQAMRDSPWALPALLLLFVVLAPLGLPMTPLIIAGGILFGRFWGALVNTLGCVLGAAVSYQLARLLGRDFVLRVAGKRLKRVEHLLRRRGFWSLVGVRFLPVPFPVVNFGAALAGVPFTTFLLTAVLGLLPALSLYTTFASTLFDVASGGDRSQLRTIVPLMLLVIALSLVPTVVQQVRRRRRYRQLLLARQARTLGPSSP